MAVKEKERHCPNCAVVLVRKYPRRMIFECPNCHNLYKAVVKRRKRSSFDPNDSRTWRARCSECGGTMEYGNHAYHCMGCGNILYV